MPGRSLNLGEYRFGFNGKEDDGETGYQDYGFRIYDRRLGRFLSVDPLSPQYPWYTPYQFAGNKPIWAVDLDGLEERVATGLYVNPDGSFATINFGEIIAELVWSANIAWRNGVYNDNWFGQADVTAAECNCDNPQDYRKKVIGVQGGFLSPSKTEIVPKAGFVQKGVENLGYGAEVMGVVFSGLGSTGNVLMAKIPFGFSGLSQFVKFGGLLKAGLKEAGFENVTSLMQGSAVTGKKYTTGEAFDVGRISDFDIALASKTLLDKAKELGISLRSSGTRTGPLKGEDIEKLGLTKLVSELSGQADRPVNFMIFESIETAVQQAPSIIIP